MNSCQEVKNGPVLWRLEHDDDPSLTVNSSARLQNARQGAVSAAERAGAGPVEQLGGRTAPWVFIGVTCNVF